jgi:hypothetical protein
VNDKLAHESANRVLEQHANSELGPDEPEQSHYEKLRSQNNRINAMQRLALQKGKFIGGFNLGDFEVILKVLDY